MSKQAPRQSSTQGSRSKGARPGGKSGSTIDPIRVLRQHVLGIIVSAAIGSVLGALLGSWLMTEKLKPSHVKIIIGIVLERYIIKGMAAGAVK